MLRSSSAESHLAPVPRIVMLWGCGGVRADDMIYYVTAEEPHIDWFFYICIKNSIVTNKCPSSRTQSCRHSPRVHWARGWREIHHTTPLWHPHSEHSLANSTSSNRSVGVSMRYTVHDRPTHCGVVEDDVFATHVAVENVFLQMLNQRSLNKRKSSHHKSPGQSQSSGTYSHAGAGFSNWYQVSCFQIHFTRDI